MEQLKLSKDLIEAVLSAVQAADPEAEDDFVAIQYLAAINGFLVANQDFPLAQKRDLLEQLHALTQSVLEDVEESHKPADSALGVWRPGDP